MFVFQFIDFCRTLDIQPPKHDGIPENSPILIYFKKNGNYTKHEFFKIFNKLLTSNNILYLRPLKNLTNEWIVDLNELKDSFNCLEKLSYLNGIITIEPKYEQRIDKDEYSDSIVSIETILKIKIQPNDLKILELNQDIDMSGDLNQSLKKFHKDHKKNDNCGFLMMKFEDTKIQSEIANITKEIFKKQGISLLRADDKWYSDDLFTNIKTYMQGCTFGVALFERIKTNHFNPNVSLEIGYMMALNKPILFLKDSTLESLHSDLIGKLYYEFDFQNHQERLSNVINKWIIDKEII
jgi:hypothetical protein